MSHLSPRLQFSDLQAAYLLLHKYTKYRDLQVQAREQQTALNELQLECQELRETVRSDKEASDARYEELSQLRMEESQAAKAVEENLKKENDEWKS